MRDRILTCIGNILCVIGVAVAICLFCYWSIIYYPFPLTGQAKLVHLLLIGFTFLFSIVNCIVTIIIHITTEVERRWYERELRKHYENLQKRMKEGQKC